MRVDPPSPTSQKGLSCSLEADISSNSSRLSAGPASASREQQIHQKSGGRQFQSTVLLVKAMATAGKDISTLLISGALHSPKPCAGDNPFT